MTTVYFVRHAQPNYDNHDDLTRELTARGLADSRRVTALLWDRGIDAVLSSPYKRAADTLRDFAEARGLAIRRVDGFRERKVGSAWIEDCEGFCRRQWADFDFRLPEGESLREVRARNIDALNRALEEYAGLSIAIGSHGTALSTIINYFDASFGYDEFARIRNLMPWIVRFEFDGRERVSIDMLPC